MLTTTATSEGSELWPRLPRCVIHRAQGGAIELVLSLAEHFWAAPLPEADGSQLLLRFQERGQKASTVVEILHL